MIRPRNHGSVHVFPRPPALNYITRNLQRNGTLFGGLRHYEYNSVFKFHSLGLATADIESVDSCSKNQSMKQHKVQKVNVEVNEGERSKLGVLWSILARLERRGDVELRGCMSVPYEEKIVKQYWNILSLWFCMSCNPLP